MADSKHHAERNLLATAQAGDEQAFAELIGEFRAELHTHCYRMLGSVHDADDALQDTLLRAWRGLDGFEGRSSLRRWLYRIATNVCLSMIGQRARRGLPIDLIPAAESGEEMAPPVEESIWLGPYPDDAAAALRDSPDHRAERRENIELAFVAAVQHLPANERAVLLLCEVIGFSAREVADLVDASVPAVNSALQRARRIMDGHIGRRTPRTAARCVDDLRIRRIITDYVDAFENGDVAAMVALLTDDVTWSMPPSPTWFRGTVTVADFLAHGPMRQRWRHLPTSANSQPAVACYLWKPDRQLYVGSVIDVLTFREDRIASVTAFVDGGLFPRFGLPADLPVRSF